MSNPKSRGSWLLLAVVAVGGISLGWAGGNWSACTKTDCTFNADLFGGLGTWFGGLATALTVAVAAHQLSIQLKQDREQRDAVQVDLRAAATSAVSAAIGVEVDVQPYVELGVGVNQAAARVTNATLEPLGNLRVRLGQLPEQTTAAIGPGDGWEYKFEFEPGSKVGSVHIPTAKNISRLDLEWLKEELTGEFEMHFEVRGHRLHRMANTAPRLVDKVRGY